MDNQLICDVVNESIRHVFVIQTTTDRMLSRMCSYIDSLVEQVARGCAQFARSASTSVVRSQNDTLPTYIRIRNNNGQIQLFPDLFNALQIKYTAKTANYGVDGVMEAINET